MTINGKKLMNWVNSFPSTEATLKKLDTLELSEIDRDHEFVAELPDETSKEMNNEQ